MATIHSIKILSDDNGENGFVTGRADGSSCPYDFEIIRPLSDLGYSVNVLDILPTKDKNGYEWSAKIKKRNPMIVNDREYYKLTNCSGGYKIKDFSIEQVQQILIDHGYEIIVHYGKAEIEETQSEWGSGEVRRTGRRYIEDRAAILAVTPEQKKNLPEWISSHGAHLLNFLKVFDDLIKTKLTSTVDNIALLKRIEDLENRLNKQDNDVWTKNVERNERR